MSSTTNTAIGNEAAPAAIDLSVPVVVHIDGSCIGNPGPGGWGYTMRRGDQMREDSGRDPATTNNRMELQAAIEALSIIKAGSVVEVVTDSEYVKNGMTSWLPGWKAKGWRKASGKPVENVDLWQRLEEVVGLRQVSWRWVKGHSGDPGNERANELAQRAARSRSVQ